MSDPPAGVLVTRPDPAAQETAQRVRACGYTAILAPMLTIEPLHWAQPLPRAQAVLVTSANALAAMRDLDRAMPVLAVGDATAALATASGFTRVESAGRDAAALCDLAARRCRPADGALLLASGVGLGLDLAADLRRRGFAVQRRVAYRAQPAPSLPADAADAIATKQIRYALFFSAVSARAFVACMFGREEALREVEALAISGPTARALAPLPWRRIRVASHPNQDELVALLS